MNELKHEEEEQSGGEGEEGGEDTEKEEDAGSDAPVVSAGTSTGYVHLSCVHCKDKCPNFSVSYLINFCLLSVLINILYYILLYKRL